MRTEAWFAFACALPLSAAASVFSGQVRSGDAQPLFTPPANSSPVVLRYFLADGTTVNPGDVVLRIDAGESAVEIRTLDAKIDEAQAKASKEAAELQLKAVDAELALVDAQAALDTASVDAAIPKNLESALDFDRFHAELERSQNDAVFKRQQLADAEEAVRRRVADGKLELDKIVATREFHRAEVKAAEVRALRAGTIVHNFNSVFGGRFEEGSSSYPGQEVGEVVASGSMSARAWVLEPDRAGLTIGEPLKLAFDALPGRSASGTLKTISGASEARAEWGNGRYFALDIDIDGAAGLPLKPGMSVRVETLNARAAHATTPTQPARAQPAAIVEATGDVFARSVSAITPPAIDDLWQMTITEMATDGQNLKKGDLAVSFDGGEVLKQLTAKKSELEEKIRTQDKLHLELADKARTETLTTAQAIADAVKAQRKATQPEAFLPGVEYKKLIIARHKAEQHESISRRRELVAAQGRIAEQQLADGDVARLKADVARIEASVQSLNIKAARDGIFLHGTLWDGSKIDTGKQIWRGVAVGEIPDMSTLSVRAALAERDLTRVHLGDRARVILEGGAGQTLVGRIDDIGLSVHSKSRVEPVPVIDLRITLDPTQIALKPGQPVRVEIDGNAQSSIASSPP